MYFPNFHFLWKLKINIHIRKNIPIHVPVEGRGRRGGRD